MRIWDIRQARACHCITGCFASSVDSLAFSTTKNNEIFASSGRSLFSFDLRNSKVVVNNPLSKISDIATDDINSIAVHPSGQYLAMTDDNCTITILNMTSNPPTTNRISNGHTNIIGSLSFKPNNKKELATGGFDFNVCFWDFQSRILKGSHSFSRRDLLEAKKGDNQQFFNPPFVQAINYMCGGKALVCALGDGSVSSGLRLAHSSTANFLFVCVVDRSKHCVGRSSHCWQCTMKLTMVWSRQCVVLVNLRLLEVHVD